MTRGQIMDRIMRGDLQGITRQDIDRLYPNMPLTAAGIWDNVQEQQRRQNGTPNQTATAGRDSRQ